MWIGKKWLAGGIAVILLVFLVLAGEAFFSHHVQAQEGQGATITSLGSFYQIPAIADGEYEVFRLQDGAFDHVCYMVINKASNQVSPAINCPE